MGTFAVVTLQSAPKASNLGLSPGVTVAAVEGPLGVIVEGIDLADDLDGDQVRSLVTICNNAGVMLLRGLERLTSARQASVVEWFGRRFSRGASPDRSTSSRSSAGCRSSCCRSVTAASPATR
jgi:alpha-ketoglutarate-dependent taurine dioxygenase